MPTSLSRTDSDHEIRHPFGIAMQARDAAAATALLAEDVVFSSPIVYTPYAGRAAVSTILRAVVRVFDDFRYVHEISDATGVYSSLIFRGRISGLQIEGSDFIRCRTDGLIDELVVMVRPLTAAQTLAVEMTAEFATGPVN